MNNIELLNKFNFKFNKSFGQNFIFDQNFLKSIVSLIDINKNTNVLEIGPGAGTLTYELCNNAKKVICYEIDKSLQPILNERLNEFNNYEIVYKDILKENTFDIEKLFNNEKYVIVANLPYYITTPIIFKFIEESKNLTSMNIMVQKEVADRIISKCNSKEYGAITVSIDYRATAKIIKNVKRTMFTPAPNVDSAIVQINFDNNKYNIKSSTILDKLIKSAFAMRRKTLSNNLKNDFKFSNEIIETIFNKVNIPINIRGEALNTFQFVELANQIYNISK